MKLLMLFSILLSGTCSLLGASGDLQVNPSQQASARSPLQVDELSANPTSNMNWLGLPNQYGTESSVCYKMRSYHVVRLDRDSDVTRQAGYSTCEPASRFGVKKTIQKMAEPDNAVSR